MITKPKFTPKMGYVERINENGEHYYHPTQETIEKELLISENKALAERVLVLEADNLALQQIIDTMLTGG